MRLRIAVLAVFVVLISMTIALAQDNCSALVETALQEIGDNCGDMGRNSACYGYQRVEATFTQAFDDDYFNEVSDRASLSELDIIRTAPLSVDQSQWGIALMSVQANIPNTLPGQAVTFLLLGDVEVENQVDSATSFQPADAVTVTTVVGSNLRSGPSTFNNVLLSAPASSELQADARSEDSRWLRVVYNDNVAWISRDLVNTDADLDALPVLTEQSYSPMQAFYFTTGVGESLCGEPPSSLIIQGPGSMEVAFEANGADFRIGSTVILRELGDGQIQLIVVDGYAEVNGVVVPGGFTMTASLDEEGNIIPNSWTGFRAVTQAEIDAYSALEQIEVDEGDTFFFLNYPIRFPTQGDIQNLENAVSGSGGGSSTTGTTASGTSSVNCAAFQATSPLGTAQDTQLPFYWDPAQGDISGYTFRIKGANGSVAYETTLGPATTNVTTHSGAGGQNFTWEVDALYVDENGVTQVACTTSAGPIELVAPVATEEPEVTNPKPLKVSTSCSLMYYLKVSWENAPRGDSVTVKVVDDFNNNYTQTVNNGLTYGSVTINLAGYSDKTITVTTSSGKSKTLNNTYTCP